MNKTALAFVIVLLASPLRTEAQAGLLPYTDAEAVAHGRVIYEAQCAACHGTNLEGQNNWRDRDADGYLPAPPHDETGHTWHHPDSQLFLITKHGTEAIVGNGYKSNMMGFGDVLTDQEILAVLAYIKSTWPRRVVDTHNRINQDAMGPDG
jgi:mono/diheme cytochrome c family protein